MAVEWSQGCSPDVLIFDLTKPTKDDKDCLVIDGESGELPHTWMKASRSFGEWLDQLVVAQGAKYWRCIDTLENFMEEVRVDMV